MEEKRTACEVLISGKWYLIPVNALRNYKKKSSNTLQRCPECKSKIKLMKESHDGKKAHFEHYKRNSSCSHSVAFGNHQQYGNNEHTYIEATTIDINTSTSHEDLLEHVIRESTHEPKPVDEDLDDLIKDSNISDTEKRRLISSRVGQGIFRKQLVTYWKGCAATSAQDISMLVASHIKPWSMSNNSERLDKYNGLLLSPNIDRAFDQGLISFHKTGRIMISPQLRNPLSFGIDDNIKVKIESRHCYYLAFHREFVFKNRNNLQE